MQVSPSARLRVELEVHKLKENYEKHGRTRCWEDLASEGSDQRIEIFGGNVFWRPRIGLNCCTIDDNAVVEIEAQSYSKLKLTNS